MEKDPKYIEYAEKFGEENAKYIYETMYENTSNHNRLVYIEIPETKNDGYAELCRKRTEEVGMEFVSLEGSLDLLRNLIDGDWKTKDFLTVNPGQKTVGIYDWEKIVESEDVAE